MLNEDLRIRFTNFEGTNSHYPYVRVEMEVQAKIDKLQKQVDLYQEMYHDIDIGTLHEKNRKLVREEVDFIGN